MGTNDRAIERKDVSRAKKAEARQRRANVNPAKGTADWGSADADLLRAAIEAVAGMGGALRLGYTRDGGAYAIGVYGDGEPFTEYIPPSEDLSEYLKGLIEDYGK